MSEVGVLIAAARESASVKLPVNVASGSKMKILLVAHKFPPFIGGIEMHTFEVGRRMAQKGHAVTVLTGDPTGNLTPDEMVSGMRVLRVRVYPKGSDIFFAPGIFHMVAREEWDIIHVQGFHTFVPPIAMMAAIYKSVPFVMTFHSGGHSSRARQLVRGVQREVMRPLLVRAAQLIGVSRFEADHFADALRISRDKIRVVPNGAEIEAATAAASPDPQKPLILSIGRLERYKGHHRVIEAFAELLKVQPNAQLRVLGEGPYMAQLTALVEQLKLENRVYIGGIPPEDRRGMGAMLLNASAIVLLSEYEAHPVAALEAISLGCRVIANNSTGFHEMVEQGLLRGIDPNASAATVAQAILEEIERPQQAKPKIDVSDWERCTLNLLDAYESVLSRHTGSGSVHSRQATASGSSLSQEPSVVGS